MDTHCSFNQQSSRFISKSNTFSLAKGGEQACAVATGTALQHTRWPASYKMHKRETRSKQQKGKRATKSAQVSPVLSGDTKAVWRVSPEQKAAWWLRGGGGATGDTGMKCPFWKGWLVGGDSCTTEWRHDLHSECSEMVKMVHFMNVLWEQRPLATSCLCHPD